MPHRAHPSRDDVRPPGDLPDLRAAFGHRLRDLRHARGVSARALAHGVGVSSGFISQLENGHVMPSVATLIALASRLNIKVGDLFEASPTAHGVLKAQERVAYEANPGVTDVILSLDGSDKLEVILGYIAPGAGSGEELYEHGADTEFVLVMKGEIEVQLGAEAVVLEEGDALTFSGDVKHGYLNRTSEPVELLWVMTPATY